MTMTTTNDIATKTSTLFKRPHDFPVFANLTKDIDGVLYSKTRNARARKSFLVERGIISVKEAHSISGEWLEIPNGRDMWCVCGHCGTMPAAVHDEDEFFDRQDRYESALSEEIAPYHDRGNYWCHNLRTDARLIRLVRDRANARHFQNIGVQPRPYKFSETARDLPSWRITLDASGSERVQFVYPAEARRLNEKERLRLAQPAPILSWE